MEDTRATQRVAPPRGPSRASEIGLPFSISISLIAVAPYIRDGRYRRRLFREFAIVLSTAILVSMIVSLTATPMMCAHLLR